MCDMTHSYVTLLQVLDRHSKEKILFFESCHTYVTWRDVTWRDDLKSTSSLLSHVTRTVWCNSCICGMTASIGICGMTNMYGKVKSWVDKEESTSCHTYEWVMSHIWMSHVTRTVWCNSCICGMTASIGICGMTNRYGEVKSQVLGRQSRGYIMSHIWMSHGTHMNESCHTYEWVMLHIWISHVTHMNESCRTYEWVMAHIWMSYVRTYEWVMSHIWVSHVTHMNESCHTYEWVLSHIWMSHVTRMNESCHTYEWVISHVWMSLVTHMNESCHAARMNGHRSPRHKGANSKMPLPSRAWVLILTCKYTHAHTYTHTYVHTCVRM